MTIGFALMGVYGIWWVLTREKPFRDGANLFRPWQFDHFRGFIRQLAASSIETFAYSASQFTMLYFLARSGTGAISANNCATRIGMLGFSLLAQPLTLFMQAQLCTHQDKERKKMIGTFLLGTAACTCLLAVGLFLFRVPVIQLVYMRGKFSQTALQQVAEMLPAWLGYFVVLSMNAVASRYMFTVGRGSSYARHMLFGYAFTNCLRLVVAGRLPVTWIVWCAVIGEGTAFFANLRSCVIEGHFRLPKIATPDPESASAC
jgi:peptidoglycan biosynthesis protein MviN/MurJ (putative lipid II flippase)